MSLRTGLATMLFTTQLGAVAEANEAGRAKADTPAYDFDVVYTADIWRNARGGLRTGAVYLDNLDLTLGIDGERAWGIPGLEAFAYVLYNNEARFSERYVGDAMTVSNIDAARAVRLYEAWMQWSGGEAQPYSMRFGLYDLNSEFDSDDSRSLFIHSSHGVGHELGQTGENGPSIFPVTSLGARFAWQPAHDWQLLAAVLDGVPGDRDDPNRSGVHLSSDEGALAITEAQWSHGRVRKLSLGHWRYTADFDDVRSTDATPLPRRDDNIGTYAALEVALGEYRDEEPSAAVFIRYGVANGHINEFDEFVGVGVHRQGLIAARSDDQVGLAFSWGRVSAATRAAAALAGTPRDHYEAAIELTYRAVVNEWLTIQPDLQFIFNPGADSRLADSLALGIRFEFSPLGLR
jgi:porin